jgi:hypothetical protein
MNPMHAEFQGFPPAVPLVESASPVDRLQRFAQLQQRHGGLVPVMVLSDLIGVCRQRIGQIKGRFNLVDYMGREFVSVPELEAFLAKERLSGSPLKRSQSS